MRLEVGTVSAVCEGALVGVTAACGYGLFTEQRWAADFSPLSLFAIHFTAVYAVTFLSFAKFVRSRRMDLVQVVMLASALGEIARPAFGQTFNLDHLAADACGALAVLVPSFMERFRSLVRSEPHEPFAMVYPNDRRRRRSARASKASLG